MHRSIPAAPMPPLPGLPPGISIISFLDWQIPGDGGTYAAKCPALGTKEEGKCPAPRDRTSSINTAAAFHLLHNSATFSI